MISFFNSWVIRKLEEFMKISDVIVVNKISKKINGVKDKLYLRFLFDRDYEFKIYTNY